MSDDGVFDFVLRRIEDLCRRELFRNQCSVSNRPISDNVYVIAADFFFGIGRTFADSTFGGFETPQPPSQQPARGWGQSYSPTSTTSLPHKFGGLGSSTTMPRLAISARRATGLDVDPSARSSK